MVGRREAQSYDRLMKKTARSPRDCPCGFEARGQSEPQRPGEFACSISRLAELSQSRA
jgi:hypothetical protein